MKRSKTSDQARLLAQAQDCLCERDPEAYRKLMLRLGGTPEEAEAYAQWAIRSNAQVAQWRQEDEAEDQTEDVLAKAS